MSVSVLAILAVASAFPQAATNSATIPTDDKALLMQASRACHLHPGAAYFVQHGRLIAPSIRLTRALGDTDSQIVCVLQGLPADFVARYSIDTETAPAPVKERRGGEGQASHRRRSLSR